MQHTLLNPNMVHSYGITAKDNLFSNTPIFISIKDHIFALPIMSKGTVLGVSNRNPVNLDLHTLPHIILAL